MWELVSILRLGMGLQGLLRWKSSESGSGESPWPLLWVVFHPFHLREVPGSPGAVVTKSKSVHGNRSPPDSLCSSSARLSSPGQSAPSKPAGAVVEWFAGDDVTGGRGRAKARPAGGKPQRAVGGEAATLAAHRPYPAAHPATADR